MKLRNSVNGNTPFEGDRTFTWRTIPANAKVVSAIATVTPVDSRQGGPFSELLSFKNGTGDFGATKSEGTAGGRPWVEVDFHSRRTVAGMTGGFGIIVANNGGCELQVDVGGGTYVEINQNGAFRTPSDPPDSFFRVGGGAADLPALTVVKLKATNRTAGDPRPTLSTIRVRSVPTQVSLRIGDLPPFWTHVGEMTLPETTPDFTAVLKAALTTAKVENGFYDLPITVHSDSIARLKVELEIEFLVEQEVFTKAVPEVVLPFDVSTLSPSNASELKIEVPFNSRVVPGETSARVRGAFTETRILSGPRGEDKPTAAVEVSRSYSQAQIVVVKDEVSPISDAVTPQAKDPAASDIFTLKDEAAVVAVDLLLEALTPSARLQLDIRGDFDGKPDEIPLLPAPASFEIEQKAEKGASWTSVPLPSEFLFAKAKGKAARYWLLLQCLEGRAAWSVLQVAATPGDVSENTAEVVPKKETQVNTQATRDGGLSWQDTALLPGTLRDLKATPPYIAFFRLRVKPKTFKMPIRLQIGSGDNAVQKELTRFEPLGRVDFTLDTELAEGINEYLQDATAAAPPETQHLANADFEKWEKRGDEMRLRRAIDDFGVDITAVAFAPDGTLAYVLDQGRKNGSLLLIDVDCNQEIREKRIDFGLLEPRAFVVSPDGTRAYITDGDDLRIVDLIAEQIVGTLFDLELDQEGAVDQLVLNRDGNRLYAASFRNETVKFNRIRIIDTPKLEQQVTTGATVEGVMDRQLVPGNASQQRPPQAIALSPDEKELYLLVDRGTGEPTPNSVVEFIDTANLTAPNPPSVEVGLDATALALSPDGKSAVVTNQGANTVSIVDIVARSAANPVGVGQLPRLAAISPDGSLAYVLNQADRTISVIDIGRRVVVGNPFPLNDVAEDPTAQSIALSPAGDQMYVANSVSETLSSIQFGIRLPAEWQVTSGEVRPMCLPAPFHLVVEMGSSTLPTSFSQVVPVAASTPYELSFWGIAFEPDADEPPALAEVLWLNDTCGLLQADSIPIEVRTIPQENDLLTAEFADTVEGRNTPLVFHQLATREVDGKLQPLTSPAGAMQAEVRFSVGKTAVARIDLASLSATSELVGNGDFKQQKDNQLVGWTLVPNATPGFTVTETDGGLQLANVGATTAELVQTVEVESEQAFSLEFQGKASVGPSLESPRIELRWLKANGSAAGEATLLQILPAGLDSAIASATAPKDSSKVEIHVVVPPKTTLEVKRVSLRPLRTTTVPVKFIADAPGDLTVSDVRVAFEEVAPQAPKIPTGGRLCTTTPPGSEPGKRGGSCYCHKCKEETVMTNMRAVMTEAGQPAIRAACSTCKTELLSVGGRMPADAQALPRRQSRTGRPVLLRAAPLTRSSTPAAVAMELTDIRGVGESRARQLREIGIDSVEKLAAATPATIGKIKFITPQMAAKIIAQAKSRLARP